MSHHNSKLHDDVELYQDELDEIEISNTDYGFIITSSGQLKTFFCPDHPDGWPPKEVQKIFKIFKISDLSEIMPYSTTLH